jgi:hypothetical protein
VSEQREVESCPGCPEGWREIGKPFCSQCYEGQIASLRAQLASAQSFHTDAVRQWARARKALEDVRQRIYGPADAQMWDIRQIVDAALSLTDENGK